MKEDTTSQETGFNLHNESTAVTFYEPEQNLQPSDLVLARGNTWLEHCIAVFSLLVFFGLFYFVSISFWVALYLVLVHKSTAAAVLVALIIADALLPAHKEWRAFRDWTVFDTWRRYFQMKILLPKGVVHDPKKTYLVAQYPHACFPMGAFLVSILAEDRRTGFNGATPGVVATILLQLPIFKRIFAWSACQPATQENLQSLLQRHTVGMIPEGVAGIFKGANRRRESIYLTPRKGFIRLAIIAGSDLVPVYHLGNSQLLTYAGSAWLSRKARMTIGLFWGWRGLPLPHPQEIICCVGHPIPIVQNSNPSTEEILKVQKQLSGALKQLYNQHRHLIGWENRDLTVI